MDKHTPGPWRWYDDTDEAGKNNRHEIVAVGKTVARIYATKGAEAEDAANARLIAAAPDLLVTLELIRQRCNTTVYGAEGDIWQMATAAIAKASA